MTLPNCNPEVVITYLKKGEYYSAVVLSPTIQKAINKLVKDKQCEHKDILSVFTRANIRGI